MGHAARRSALAAAAVALGVLISGVELAPFLYLLATSHRSEVFPAGAAGLWSLAPRDVAVWVLPRFGLQVRRQSIAPAGVAQERLSRRRRPLPRRMGARRRTPPSHRPLRRRRPLLPRPRVWRLVSPLGPSPQDSARLRHDTLPREVLPALCLRRRRPRWPRRRRYARDPRERLRRVFALAVALAVVAVIFLAVFRAIDVWPGFFRSRVFLPRAAGTGADQDALAKIQFVMTQWSFRHSGMMLLLAAVAVWAVASTRHRVAALLLGAVVAAGLFLFAPSLTPTTGPLIYTMPAVRAAAVDRAPGARRVYHTRAFDTFAGYAPFTGFGGVDRLHDYMAALKGSDWATPERLLEWASQAVGRRMNTFEDLDACLHTAEGDALIGEAAHYERLKEAFSQTPTCYPAFPSSGDWTPSRSAGLPACGRTFAGAKSKTLRPCSGSSPSAQSSTTPIRSRASARAPSMGRVAPS